jgi:hypothetical protein
MSVTPNCKPNATGPVLEMMNLVHQQEHSIFSATFFIECLEVKSICFLTLRKIKNGIIGRDNGDDESRSRYGSGGNRGEEHLHRTSVRVVMGS